MRVRVVRVHVRVHVRVRVRVRVCLRACVRGCVRAAQVSRDPVAVEESYFRCGTIQKDSKNDPGSRVWEFWEPKLAAPCCCWINKGVDRVSKGEYGVLRGKKFLPEGPQMAPKNH